MNKIWIKTINKYLSKGRGVFEIGEDDIPVFDEMMSFILNYVSKQKFHSNFENQTSDYNELHILDEVELKYLLEKLRQIEGLFI